MRNTLYIIAFLLYVACFCSIDTLQAQTTYDVEEEIQQGSCYTIYKENGDIDTVLTYSGVFGYKGKTYKITVKIDNEDDLACNPNLKYRIKKKWLAQYADDPTVGEDEYYEDLVSNLTNGILQVSTDNDIYVEVFFDNEDELDFEWSAEENGNYANILSPTETTVNIKSSPKTNAVYNLRTTQTASKDDYEMVYNGNFEEGNWGFTSDFHYLSKEMNPGGVFRTYFPGAPSTYAIGTSDESNTKWLHPSDFFGLSWTCMPPKSSGLYLFGDGAATGGIAKDEIVYKSTFTVQKNTTYIFQAKFANLHAGISPTQKGVPPIQKGTMFAKFRFVVNGENYSDENVDADGTYHLDSQLGEWQTLYCVFNSGDKDLATIEIHNSGITDNGNDFCIDDISFLKHCQTDTKIRIINDITKYEYPKVEICDNETYDFYGTILDKNDDNSSLPENASKYDERHTYQYTDDYGIIHNVYLTVKVNPTIETFDTVTICEDESITWEGETYYKTGIYTVKLKDEKTGCDITKHLTLTVNKKTSAKRSVSINSWEDYYFADKLISAGGTYTNVGLNADGCEHIDSLIVTYNDKVYITKDICEGEEFLLGNKVLTTTGTYADSLKAHNGNDSIVMVSLTVRPTYNDTIYAKIGANMVYDRLGFYATEAGIYTQANSSIYGCDSMIVLVLDADEDLIIYVPNAFTPNSEMNNVFKIIPASEDFALEKFQIMNRWGGIVFETTDITIGWDGTYKGEICQRGTYVWVLDYYRKGEKGKMYRKTGEIFLLK